MYSSSFTTEISSKSLKLALSSTIFLFFDTIFNIDINIHIINKYSGNENVLELYNNTNNNVPNNTIST